MMPRLCRCLAAAVMAMAVAWPTCAWSVAALTACRVAGIRNGVLCGVVQRALDPARPEGPQIEVHYVVVAALARRKWPDPVFVLAGGPGQSAIALAPSVMPLLNRLNNRRDIVFVDQRGTGKSAPLVCDDPRHASIAEQSDPQRQIQRLAVCRLALQTLPYVRAPGDLRFFTTTLAMQDLDAVRLQLGVERINLLGASYGTRAALEYLRLFPAQVRRSVMDGVAPPDMALPASFSSDGQAAFDALFAACDQEAACTRAYPSLRADWATLLRSLPRPVTLAHPVTGAPESLTLTRDVVLGTVRGALYSAVATSGLPAAMHEAAQGRIEGLVGLGALVAPRKGTALALGMHFAVVCSEDVPLLTRVTDAPGRDFGADFANLYQAACADWPRGEVSSAFYTVPASTAPVLLLSGGIDPATPPRHAERVARALGPAARHVVVPHGGHGVMGIGCMRDVIYRFIDAEEDRQAHEVDAACVTNIPRPPAFQPLATLDRVQR
jgi:pimeloyl-ACP methyl ester carboxylesterase